MMQECNTEKPLRKPLILRKAVERVVEAREYLFTYDPVSSLNRLNGGRLDYTQVVDLMTKTERGREEDSSDCDYIVLDCMTKTFSSQESDD